MSRRCRGMIALPKSRLHDRPTDRRCASRTSLTSSRSMTLWRRSSARLRSALACAAVQCVVSRRTSSRRTSLLSCDDTDSFAIYAADGRGEGREAGVRGGEGRPIPLPTSSSSTDGWSGDRSAIAAWGVGVGYAPWRRRPRRWPSGRPRAASSRSPAAGAAGA